MRVYSAKTNIDMSVWLAELAWCDAGGGTKRRAKIGSGAVAQSVGDFFQRQIGFLQ